MALKRIFSILISAAGFFILSACASWGSGLRIVNVERPLVEIQKAVTTSLPLGQRRVDKGGMRFYSKYFVVRGRKFASGDTAPIRYYAQVYILGDRRPYVIEVYVNKQRRVSAQSSEYADEGSDQEIANVVYQRIQFQLSKRREDLNIIDDFRIF